MTRRSLALLLAPCALFLLACPEGPSGEDAGPEPKDGGGDPADDDGGPDDDDAGAADDDAGPGDDDAGPPPDPTSGSWSLDYGLPGAVGFGARVSSFVEAGDGSVYIGGTFTHISGTRASNVARYDGESFTALGDGLPGWVNALALDGEGNLYAGGWLVDDEVGGENHLMRWDGTSWEAVGPALDGDINAIAALSDGSVVFGGTFTQITDTESGGLAVVDEDAFRSLGGAAPNGSVSVIYEDDALGVCVGGMFDAVGETSAMNVACYREGVWSQLGDGLNGEVRAFLRDANGDLLVGGGFAFFDAEDPFASEVGLALYEDGAFHSHAGGVVDGSITSVRSLSLLSSGQVLVGGCFMGAGVGEEQVFSPHLALLNPDRTWTQPDEDGGLVNTVGLFVVGIEGTHATLVTSEGDVLVGGLFTEAAEHLAPNLAEWSAEEGFAAILPEEKRFLGVSGLVNEMAVAGDGTLYLGGYFSWAGTTRAENVVKLEGGSYEALGGGLDGPIHALAVLPDGTPVAGGEFYSEPGGVEVPFLAQFTEGAWRDVAGAPDGGVFALAVDRDGALLVGGDFLNIGATAAPRIARIKDGVVERLGGDLGGRVTGIVADADGSVVVSGLFQGGEQNPLPGVARWDGSEWQAIGGDIDGEDYASTVALYQGDVVVGGPFESIGGVPVTGLARFDGASWSSLGDGLAAESGFVLVSAIATWDHLLFATGIFDEAGGEPASFVAVFDGEDWYPMDGGLNDLGEALVVDRYGLLVGGPFVAVDGETPSVGIGRYTFGDD